MQPQRPEFIPAPTITRYQQLANDVMQAIDAMMVEVPKLEAKERRSKAFIRTHIGISPEFVMRTAGAVEYTPELDRMEQMNVAAAHAARQLGDAFLPVVRRLAGVTDELQLLLDTKQALAAAEALKMYELAKALARRKHDPVLLTMVRAMKRELGPRGRPRKKKAAAASDKPAKKKTRRASKPRSAGQRLDRRVDRRVEP